MCDLYHLKRSLTNKYQLIISQYEVLGIPIYYFVHTSKTQITAILGQFFTIVTQNLGKEWPITPETIKYHRILSQYEGLGI